MPANNMMILMGLGAAALWFMNRGGTEEDQVDQLAGASMMASGEGTAPDAPFQAYSAPGNPSWFFNAGGQMTRVPSAPLPPAVTSGEDIGRYPGPDAYNRPELEFEVARSNPPIGTTDISPTTPEFAGDGDANVIPSTVWDDQVAIATANEMPLLAIQTEGGTISVLGSNVDIATISSDETFRAINVGTGHVWTSDRETVAEAILQGYFTPRDDAYVPKTWQEIERESGLTARQEAAASDEDIGTYPGGDNQPELEFTVDRSIASGTFDISPTTPQFAGTRKVDITPAAFWDGGFVPSGIDPIAPIVSIPAAPAPAFFASGIDTIASTVRPEPSTPVWAGGGNWWDEG